MLCLGCEPREDVREVPSTWPFPLTASPMTSTRGMVATDAPLATLVGADVLSARGNAVDAAVATAFALAVVLPSAGNVGGGGFLVVHMADGTNAALDFREVAPARATRDMFLDGQGNPTDRSLNGHLAAGVPGSVAGLWEAHRRFGSKPWAELVEPAIRLAEDGFVVDAAFANRVRRNSGRLAAFPASASLFVPGGQPLSAGSGWRNPDLAAVLRRIAERGARGFYEGETATLLVAEMERGGGLISKDDLAAYRAKWREPANMEYRGRRIISMPLPSSGGITLALMANMLRVHPAGRTWWGSPDRLHLLAEASRRAFAVRNQYLGDPDFVQVPHERLLSQGFADTLFMSFSPTRATSSSNLDVGTGADTEGTHTTHFSVVDPSGNAVGLTTTINTGFGSGVVVTGAGFLLNNEMDDFTSKPGSPNTFGLVQGEANAIAPGKRMLSSMTPTIVLDEQGGVLLVTGASGGPTIISTVWQIMSHVVDDGMDIAAAVSAPRIHHQHLPDSLSYDEGGFSPGTLAGLEERGHRLKPVSPGSIGIGASLMRSGSEWTGMADPRIAGSAAGPR